MVNRVSVVLTALAVVICGYAMAGSSPGRAASQEPRTAVVLRVQVGERVVGVVKVRSGERAFLTFGDGTRLALSPELNGGRLQLLVRDISLSEQSESLVFAMGFGEPVVINSAHALSVEWLKTDTALPMGATDDDPCRTCCITCDGFTLCACEVLMSCGHCCCKSACTCEFQAGQ